ncbi:MAG: GMC family oxidoreductase [Hyphomonadaceae bacterium]
MKLLLLAQRDTPALFGGPDGPLGRGYMGHLTGIIADLAPADPSHAHAFAFRRVEGEIYARRRIRIRDEALHREGLPNIGFWIDNAAKEDPRHGSAVASAKVLAARAAAGFRGDGDLAPHLRNVARAPLSAAAGLSRILALHASARLTGHLPRPSLHIPSGPGMWEMRYHAEQRPDPANRVSLSASRRDSQGLPALQIDFRFGDRDVADVVRAHDLLDADLRASGAGRLNLRGTPEAMAGMVADFARDGYHQIGGAVMSAEPGAGVVDADGRVHGLPNLWVASSCTFPSGGHANPTLTIVALSLRIADRLARTSVRPCRRVALLGA